MSIELDDENIVISNTVSVSGCKMKVLLLFHQYIYEMNEKFLFVGWNDDDKIPVHEL